MLNILYENSVFHIFYLNLIWLNMLGVKDLQYSSLIRNNVVIYTEINTNDTHVGNLVVF